MKKQSASIKVQTKFPKIIISACYSFPCHNNCLFKWTLFVSIKKYFASSYKSTGSISFCSDGVENDEVTLMSMTLGILKTTSEQKTETSTKIF